MQNTPDENSNSHPVDLHAAGDGPGCGASAPPSALPCLKKDNCTNAGSQKSRFVAEENIRLYIQHMGENNVGVLTVTTPSQCLSAFEFQRKWRSLLTHGLKKSFPTGMWVRERQPRTGSWHAHCVVNVGWDIKTGFPFDQVQKRFYANVDPRLRGLWKLLREMAEKYGFGRTELLPLKASGPSCARYLVKYLVKVRGSDKSEGEEKCRLFGKWGGVGYVITPFSFTRSRILRKRKAWLAVEMGIECYAQFKTVFGSHWWHHLGPLLLEVVMPVEYYQMPKDGALAWDDLGFKAYCADIARFPECSVDDAMRHSWYRLFWEVGQILYRGDEGQVRDFALHKIGNRPEVVPVVDPQLFLQFPTTPTGED
jgi:hypothetical protein